ncbi:MAG: response regulator [Bacteroidetes bacterium]|jgi:PAS domain S-box-containing protein|nr:response regulator [Bacteroidota bacterium]
MPAIIKSAIKIAVIYASVGFVWIYTSDYILYFFTNDAEKVTQLQTYKGWFYVTGTAILLYLLVLRALTKQQNTLRLLNAQDILANQVIKNIPDIDVYIIDDDMNFLLAQGTAMKKHGLSPADVLGKNFRDVKINKEIKKYLKPWYREVLNGNNLLEQFELDNEWIELRGVPFLDANNKKLGGLIVAINITSEKKNLQRITEQRNEYETLNEEYLSTNEELNDVNIQLKENLEKLKHYYDELEVTRKKVAESEYKYRNLFDNLSDAVFVHQLQPDDKPGLILETNEAACNLLGFTKDELLQRTILDISPDEVAEISPSITQNIRSNGHYLFEVLFKSKYNTLIDVEVSSHYLELRGENLVISICRDIRERKAKEAELIEQKEKAELSDKLKSAFLANISHEIRTPMNGILGFSGMLGQDNLPRQQKEKYINIIKTSSDQLLRIIDDLLDISRIETQQLEIIESEFSLSLLMEEAGVLLEEQVKSKQKDIKTVLHYNLPENSTIIGDKERIYQILLNLITNAEKFTESGFIEIGCTIDNGFIHFRVKDSGMGIAENMQTAIFERFRQEEIVLTKALGGNGLGLPICKGLVQLMGGEIYVESVKGEGSTFRFTIPYKTGQKDIEPGLNKLQTDNFKHKSILVAEDIDESFELLQQYLKAYQINLIRARNGLETIELFNNNEQIDLILMDIRMPGMNGREATKSIRKKNADIPIIAQTAYAMPNDKKLIIESGCTDIISKPIQRESLNKILHKYL